MAEIARKTSTYDRNPFLVKEQNLTLMAAVAGKVVSTYMVRGGIGALTLNSIVKNFPYAQLSTDAMQYISAIETGSVLTIAGGAIGHLMIKLSKGVAVADLQEILSEGADRVLNNSHVNFASTNEKPYRKEAQKALVEHHHKEWKDKISSYAARARNIFKSKDLPNPYFDIGAFEKESINSLHALALLGQSNDEYAEFIKTSPYADDEVIRGIFEDSKVLTEALVGNMDNLMQFTKDIEKAMGEDALFFIKNHSDYTKGRKDFFDLKIDAIKEASKKFQKYNVHMDMCNSIASIMIESKESGLATTDSEAMNAVFSRFKNLDNPTDTNKTFKSVITVAEEISEVIGAFSVQNGAYPAHKVFQNFLQNKGVELSEKISLEEIKQAIYDGLFKKKAPAPDKFEKEVAKAMFAKMEERALAACDKMHFFDAEKRDDWNKKEIQEEMQRHGFEAFGDIKKSEAAKNAVLRVQQRLAMHRTNQITGYTDLSI